MGEMKIKVKYVIILFLVFLIATLVGLIIVEFQREGIDATIIVSLSAIIITSLTLIYNLVRDSLNEDNAEAALATELRNNLEFMEGLFAKEEDYLSGKIEYNVRSFQTIALGNAIRINLFAFDKQLMKDLHDLHSFFEASNKYLNMICDPHLEQNKRKIIIKKLFKFLKDNHLHIENITNKVK